MIRPAILLWLLFLGFLSAPAGAADLRGTVFDAANAPLPGVTMALTPPGGDPVAGTTDARGRYAFTRLQPGRHTLVALKAGYAA